MPADETYVDAAALTGVVTQLETVAAGLATVPMTIAAPAGADAVSTVGAGRLNVHSAATATQVQRAAAAAAHAAAYFRTALPAYVAADATNAATLQTGVSAGSAPATAAPAAFALVPEFPAFPAPAAEIPTWEPTVDPEITATELRAGDGGTSATAHATAWETFHPVVTTHAETVQALPAAIRTAWRGTAGDNAAQAVQTYSNWLANVPGHVQKVAGNARTYVGNYRTAVNSHPTVDQVQTTKTEFIDANGRVQGGDVTAVPAATKAATQITDYQVTGSTVMNSYAAVTNTPNPPAITPAPSIVGGGTSPTANPGGTPGSPQQALDRAAAARARKDGAPADDDESILSEAQKLAADKKTEKQFTEQAEKIFTSVAQAAPTAVQGLITPLTQIPQTLGQGVGQLAGQAASMATKGTSKVETPQIATPRLSTGGLPPGLGGGGLGGGGLGGGGGATAPAGIDTPMGEGTPSLPNASTAIPQTAAASTSASLNPTAARTTGMPYMPMAPMMGGMGMGAGANNEKPRDTAVHPDEVLYVNDDPAADEVFGDDPDIPPMPTIPSLPITPAPPT